MTRLMLLSVLVSSLGFAAAEKPRDLVIETKLIDNATHWSPEKIEVTQGEKLNIIAKHELKGGFDYHGLLIPALKITKQVNRGKEEQIPVTVPKDLKPGEYDVKCHFHSTHIGAKLVVKAADGSKS